MTNDLNDNSKITCREITMFSLNITFLQRFLYSLTTGSTKTLFLQKNLREKRSKCLLRLRFKPNVQKTAYKKKKAHRLLILDEMCFLENPNFKNVNLPKRVYLRRNHRLFFHKNPWKFFLMQ